MEVVFDGISPSSFGAASWSFPAMDVRVEVIDPSYRVGGSHAEEMSEPWSRSYLPQIHPEKLIIFISIIPDCMWCLLSILYLVVLDAVYPPPLQSSFPSLPQNFHLHDSLSHFPFSSCSYPCNLVYCSFLNISFTFVVFHLICVSYSVQLCDFTQPSQIIHFLRIQLLLHFLHCPCLSPIHMIADLAI